MNDLIEQIRKANSSGLYYVGLFTALAIPDICGGLESNDGIANKSRYIAWFDQHVAPQYSGFLDGEACYLFRCSLLHQGTTQHPSSKYSRIIFVEPNSSGTVFHNNVINDAYNIDVGVFCEDLCIAAEKWLAANSTNTTVQANLNKFVRRYPNGLPPYISGTPVVG